MPPHMRLLKRRKKKCGVLVFYWQDMITGRIVSQVSHT